MRIPRSPLQIDELLRKVGPRLADVLSAGLSQLPEQQYIHWDQLSRKSVPDDFTAEDWWLAIKLSRLASGRTLPFLAGDGTAFTYSIPPFVERMLHQVDRDASGRIALPEAVTNPQTRDRFLVRSLMEEAITSSQLEGAATTLKDAKDMVRQGREPVTRGERMIMNNYRAMGFIRESCKQPLSKEFILELHSILSEGTLDDAGAAGRLRHADEDVKVVDHRTNTTLHDPPHAATLDERLDRLIRFANRGGDEPFIHPVIKSMLIHLMIGYDHPFVDGNGRTARALFYWSMARQGYWLMEYISISSRLRLAPAKYVRSYLHTETDGFDATYFVVYQLEVILQAIRSLHEYLARKIAEVREADSWLKDPGGIGAMLNHRQIAFIAHALKHPYDQYTVKSHQRSHNVTYETARSDLMKLRDRNLLVQGQRGRAFVFHASADLQARLDEIRSESDGR
jgi:Fic family protein